MTLSLSIDEIKALISISREWPVFSGSLEDTWLVPSIDNLKFEYRIEFTMKSLGNRITNNPFKTEASFIAGAYNETPSEIKPWAQIMRITKAIDYRISYRSHCDNMIFFI